MVCCNISRNYQYTSSECSLFLLDCTWKWRGFDRIGDNGLNLVNNPDRWICVSIWSRANVLNALRNSLHLAELKVNSSNFVKLKSPEIKTSCSERNMQKSNQMRWIHPYGKCKVNEIYLFCIRDEIMFIRLFQLQFHIINSDNNTNDADVTFYILSFSFASTTTPKSHQSQNAGKLHSMLM